MPSTRSAGMLPAPEHALVPTLNIAPALGWPAGAVPRAAPGLRVVVNERDELGNDLVPDFLTSVRDGGFYGWPYSYFGQHVDTRVKPQHPARVAQAVAPDYALGAHVAPLGLVSAKGNTLGQPFASGMFIGEHGSWNRRPHSGYKVVFVPFKDGQPTGAPVDVLTG